MANAYTVASPATRNNTPPNPFLHRCAHQSCYGSELLDDDPGYLIDIWECQHCRENSTDRCLLCDEPGGILKRLDSEKWYHVQCVNWLPYVYFTDERREALNKSHV